MEKPKPVLTPYESLIFESKAIVSSSRSGNEKNSKLFHRKVALLYRVDRSLLNVDCQQLAGNDSNKSLCNLNVF